MSEAEKDDDPGRTVPGFIDGRASGYIDGMCSLVLTSLTRDDFREYALAELERMYGKRATKAASFREARKRLTGDEP